MKCSLELSYINYVVIWRHAVVRRSNTRGSDGPGDAVWQSKSCRLPCTTVRSVCVLERLLQEVNDIETGYSHSRSSPMSLFDRLHKTSDSPSVAIGHVPISCGIRDMASYWSKVANFSYPSCIWRPAYRVTLSHFHKDLCYRNRVSGIPFIVID